MEPEQDDWQQRLAHVERSLRRFWLLLFALLLLAGALYAAARWLKPRPTPLPPSEAVSSSERTAALLPGTG